MDHSGVTLLRRCPRLATTDTERNAIEAGVQHHRCPCWPLNKRDIADINRHSAAFRVSPLFPADPGDTILERPPPMNPLALPIMALAAAAASDQFVFLSHRVGGLCQVDLLGQSLNAAVSMQGLRKVCIKRQRLAGLTGPLNERSMRFTRIIRLPFLVSR